MIQATLPFDLSLHTPWPWGVFLAVFLAAGLLTLLLYRQRKLELSRPGRLLLCSFRVATLGLILACLARPAMRRMVAGEHDPNLVIAVDTSASMSIEDQDGPRSRLDGFRRVAEDCHLLAELGKRYRVKIFEFDEEAREAASFPALRARGSLTDLQRSLEGLARRAVDADTIGVVVVTDGADNGGVDTLGAARLFEGLGIPLLCVGVGREELKDVEIVSIATRRIVRMNTTVEAAVKIRQQGYDHHLVAVRITRSGEVVAEKELALQGPTATASFEFTPAEEGLLRYAVEARPLAGEVIVANNSRDFSINSSRRKIQVLYMEGTQYRRPDRQFWEFQYLVQALLEDKDVEVTPLLRDDVNAAGEAGIAYILHPDKGFPRSRKQLFTYDVILSSDIDIDYFTEGQLKNILDFVGEFGGGYAMIGGWTSFGAGGYDESIIDQMLPVDMLGREDKYATSTIRWELTPEGYDHPMMRLVDDPVKNQTVWRGMPNFHGYNYVQRAKPAATVLALHPYESTPYGRRVLLAVQHYGKGRSMAFMPDTTAGWGKDFEDYFGEGGDNRYFKKFWKNAIRWLAAYRINVPNQLVTVQTERNLYENGEKARIEVAVLNSEYEPSRDAEVELEIKSPDGQVLRRRLAADLQRDGVYPWELPLHTSGSYQLFARARDAKGLMGEDQAVFDVQSSSLEFRNYALNRALLASFAARTNGKFYGLENLPSILSDLTAVNRQAIRTETRDLWDHPLVYLALLGLLSAEWVVRKKFGLL